MRTLPAAGFQGAVLRTKHYTVRVPKKITPAVSLAVAVLRGQVLLLRRMKLAAYKTQVNLLFQAAAFLAPIQTFSVTGGKALVEIDIARIGGCRSIAERSCDHSEGLHGAEGVAHKSIKISGFQAILKACVERFPGAELAIVSALHITELDGLGAHLPSHVDVHVAEMVARFISVPVSVGEG